MRWIGVLVLLSVIHMAGAMSAAGAEDGVGRWRLTLEGAVAKEQDLTLQFHVRQGRATSGWGEAQLRGCPVYVPHDVEPEGLEVKDGKLAGRVRAGFYSPLPYDFALQGTVKNGKIEGSFEGQVLVGGKGDRVPRPVKGVIRGAAVTDERLRQTESLAAGKDYPCHRGRFGNGTTPDCGRELVSGIQNARLVWRSEEEVPGAYWDILFGGYATPVVAEGKVYLYYGWPEGKVHVQELAGVGSWTRRLSPRHRRMWHTIDGQDTVLCVDAATGKTLWKSVCDGVNLWMMQGRGPHNTVAVADGRVFVQTALGKVRCLNATTGAVIWEYDDFEAAREWEAFRQKVLKVKQAKDIPVESSMQMPKGYVSLLNACPVVADGVVCVTVGRMSKEKPLPCGVIGLDAATGRKLWGPIPDVVRDRSSCVRWTHKGREYIVGSNMCIEPRTGRILWKVDGIVLSTPAVTEDYLITNEGTYQEGIVCYRISPEKAQRVWALDKKYRIEQFASPVIHRGHVYTLVRRIEKTPREPHDLCVDLESGRVVGARGQVFMGLAGVASDNLVVSGAGCRMFDATPPKEFEATRPGAALPTAGFTSPALADGRLFVRLKTALACYDLRKPTFAQPP